MMRADACVEQAAEVLGVERRRRWEDEVKLAIVSAVGIGGATVTQLAQRHEVTRQQIYAWRHELKRNGLWSPDAGALFLPAGMMPATELTVVEPPAPVPAPVARVELRLAKGRVLRFESNIDEAALSRLIRAVDAA
jgi:transposase